MIDYSLKQLCTQLRNGQVTAESLVKAYLDRIDKFDSFYKAYQYVDRNGALEQARASDAMRAEGIDLGVLMGLPVAVKDLLHVDAMPTGAGSLLDVSATYQQVEGELVRKLRAAGCIFLGKTKTSEFALSGTGINYKNGTPVNPYSTDVPRIPGGSSSGSAVATSANLCAFSIGTDTGGSVRSPAAYCGLVGIKFGWGSFDTQGGFILSETLDSYGILTREVECARMVTNALGLLEAPASQHSPLKLGVLTTYKKLKLDAEVERCWAKALENLANDGHALTEVSIEEWYSEVDKIYSTISRAEVYTSLKPCLSSQNEDLVNPDILRKIQSGATIDAVTYITALRRRKTLIEMADKLFDTYDALITPTKPTVAPTYPQSYPGPEEDDRMLAKTGVLTREVNVLHMSGASLPIHQLGSPLPVGLQIMCRAADLSGLLQSAAIIERSVGVASDGVARSHTPFSDR